MAIKRSLKQGEKILFGIAGLFIVLAIIGYIALETVRLTSDKAMFASKTNFSLSPAGHRGSVTFRTSQCTSCHRAMRNGTNMGLSLDGLGSKRTKDWINAFLRKPEETYPAPTIDHGDAPKEAAYVMAMPDAELSDIAAFLSELTSEQGSASSPIPPEGQSDFIDSMVDMWAPESWKVKYRDVRDPIETESIEKSGE